MLYQVETGSGLMGIKYVNADSEAEAIEKAKDILFGEKYSNCCGEDGEKSHWSEYKTFIWCMTCDKDYPSVLCMPEIDDAIDVYLNSVDYLKKERSLK